MRRQAVRLCIGPLSARLYVPAGWANDSVRRRKGHVPAEVDCRTKPAVALTLVEQARPWALPFVWGGSAAGSGDNPTFLQGLDERPLP